MATVREALARALDLQEQGDATAAETIFRRILAAVPDEAATLLSYATLLAQGGRLVTAIRAARVAAAANPSLAAAHRLLGKLAQATAREAEAARAYGRALALGELDRELVAACGAMAVRARDRAALATAVAAACRGCREQDWFWKTPYYVVFDPIDKFRAGLTTEALDGLIGAAADAAGPAGEGRPDIRDWLVFLQGLLRHEREGIAAARPFYRRAEATVPMSRHFCAGTEFHDRAGSVTDEDERRLDPPVSADDGNRAADSAVLVACDSRYVTAFAPSFVMSLAVDPRPPAALHVHLVGPDDEALALLRALRGGVPFPINLTWERGLQERGGGTDDGMALTYLTVARFLRAEALMDSYPKGLIVADIDGVFLGCPRDFLGGANDGDGFDVGLLRDRGMLTAPYDGVAGGLLVLRPTAPARRFIRSVRRYLLYWLAAGEMRYSLDQIALIAALDAAGGFLETSNFAVADGSWAWRSGRYRPIMGQKSDPVFMRGLHAIARDHWSDGQRDQPERRDRHRRALAALVAPVG